MCQDDAVADAYAWSHFFVLFALGVVVDGHLSLKGTIAVGVALIIGWELFEALGRGLGWSFGAWFACETWGNIVVDVVLGALGFLAGNWVARVDKLKAKSLSACAWVAALAVLVFAGLERASISVGYTMVVAALGLSTPPAWVARAIAHPVILAVVIGATAHDVAGYDSVPWFLVVVCWGLACWVGSDFDSNAQKRTSLCLALAVLGFITGMMQFVDSG